MTIQTLHFIILIPVIKMNADNNTIHFSPSTQGYASPLTQGYASPSTQGYASPSTPDRVISEPVAPWAPSRPAYRTIHLSSEIDDSSLEDDLVQCFNALVFTDMDNNTEDQIYYNEDAMDIAEDNDYQEHYTIPEDQIYYNEDAMDIAEDNDYREHYMIPEDIIYSNEDEMDIVPHPNFTLFRGNREISDDEMSELELDYEDDDTNDVDVDAVIATFNAMEIEEVETVEQEENDYYGQSSYSEEDDNRERDIQKIKCGPDFKFVEINYRDTQGKYPNCCAMCHDTMKYNNVYETSCEHALCCDCYNNHEDYSASRCEIIRQGFIRCPIRSCRKTIRKVTGYKKRKDEKIFVN